MAKSSPAQRVWPLEIPQEWRDQLAVWQARVTEEMRSLHSRALVPLGWESEAATQPNLPILRSLMPQRPDRRQKLLLVSSLVVVAAMFISLLLPGMGDLERIQRVQRSAGARRIGIAPSARGEGRFLWTGGLDRWFIRLVERIV